MKLRWLVFALSDDNADNHHFASELVKFFSEILKIFFMFCLKNEPKPPVLREAKSGCTPVCILPGIWDSDPEKTRNRQISLFKASQEARMLRLIFVMMMAIGVASCTQAQRFELAKNAELDECAMKRMAESKINGQHGYLQAHHECHQIVNFQKFQEMRLEKQPPYVKQDLKDPLDEYGICWEFVKGLYIDEHYPEMRIPKKGPWGRLPAEGQKEIEDRNAKLKAFPDRLRQIPSVKLIEIYELMAVNSIIGHASDTLCKSTGYHELESAIGLELKRRQG